MLVPVACVVIAGCSGGSSGGQPKAQGQPAVSAPGTASPAPASAATGPAASPSGCADACGQTEPVFLIAGSYTGSRPTGITFNGTAVYDLTWSSWPSGPNGAVPGNAVAQGAGKTDVHGSPVTVTIQLQTPDAGDPASWQEIVVQISGQQVQDYRQSQTGNWTYVAGGDQFPAAQITASGGDQPQ
jgi:hypothetical protein